MQGQVKLDQSERNITLKSPLNFLGPYISAQSSYVMFAGKCSCQIQ